MRRSWPLKFGLYVVDTGLFLLGFYLAFCLRFVGNIPYYNLAPFIRLVPYIGVLVLVFFSFLDLYSHSWKRRLETLYSVAIAVLLTNMGTMSLTFVLRGFSFPRSVFLIASCIQVLLLGTWRFLWQVFLDRLAGTKSVVVIGSNGEGRELARKLDSLLGRRYNVLGIFEAETELAAAGEAISSAQVVCINTSLSKKAKEEIISRCLEEDKEVFLVPELYDILLHKAALSRVDDLPVFEIESLSLTPGQQLGKRLFDLVVASICLIACSPLMLLAAIAVRFSSPGPVFYLQKRVGFNGKVFRIIKFRTMVKDAEKISGPVLAAEGDPRITKVGRILRAARLDELPQLINVLKGDMSFVGPRPERPYFVEQFSETIPEYKYRLKVKPGITGLAQVQGKYDTEASEKLRYDLYYIRNYSLLLDLQIIFQTLRVVLMPELAKGVAANKGCFELHRKNI